MSLGNFHFNQGLNTLTLQGKNLNPRIQLRNFYPGAPGKFPF